jgi:hypothetical protein
MANQLGAKFESLGIKRKSVLIVSADLSDLYQYADDIRKYIELLLETPSSDLEKILELSVYLKVASGEMKDHIAHSRKPLEYIADFCSDKAVKKN